MKITLDLTEEEAAALSSALHLQGIAIRERFAPGVKHPMAQYWEQCREQAGKLKRRIDDARGFQQVISA